MKRQPLRAYVDTSIFGGAFDDEFKVTSRAFFDQARSGRFHLVVSAVVITEVIAAPNEVRELFGEMLEFAEVVDPSEETRHLQQAYLDAGIVGRRWAADALHVAIATVMGCSLIVSWNFRHIVHFDKIPLYNAVNILNGYASIEIYSPRGVITYEENI